MAVLESKLSTLGIIEVAYEPIYSTNDMQVSVSERFWKATARSFRETFVVGIFRGM